MNILAALRDGARDPDKPEAADLTWQDRPSLPRSLSDARDLYGEDVVPIQSLL